MGDVVLGFPRPGFMRTGSRSSAGSWATDAFDADLLLPPTRLYLDDVRALRARADVRALAHVTGGGIAGNLGRVLPDGLGAVVDPVAVGAPDVFAWLAENGVAEDELRRVFNIGIGYCAIIPAADVQPGDLVIGRVVAWERGRLGMTREPRSRRARERERHEPPGSDRRGHPHRGRGIERRRVAALERAAAAGIPTAVFALDRRTPTATSATRPWPTGSSAHGVELVVCAGYMHLLRPVFLARFPGRVVNVHPALLPAFPGAHAVEDALAAGVAETGATVHLVDEGVDTGDGTAAGGRCRAPRRHAPRRCTPASGPSSTACCPRSSGS